MFIYFTYFLLYKEACVALHIDKMGNQCMYICVGFNLYDHFLVISALPTCIRSGGYIGFSSEGSGGEGALEFGCSVENADQFIM